MSLFWQMWVLIWIKFSLLLQPGGWLKLMLNLSCRSSIQGKDVCWCDFSDYMLNMVMCQDTCKRNCFQLGMMLNTTKLYSLLVIGVSWVLRQVTGLGKRSSLCRPCVVKLPEATPVFMMLDIILGRWLWRSPVSVTNMDRLSICSSRFFREIWPEMVSYNF